MAIPIVPIAVAVAGPVAAGFAALHRRPRRLVLVGESGAGKTTLARVLASDTSPEPPSRTLRAETSSFEGIPGFRPNGDVVDLPGKDALKAWCDGIDMMKPHLVCFLADFAALSRNESDLEQVERAAMHVKDLAGRRRVALILTHMDEMPAHHPESSNAARLISTRLGTNRVCAGSLIHRGEADLIAEQVRDWLR